MRTSNSCCIRAVGMRHYRPVGATRLLIKGDKSMCLNSDSVRRVVASEADVRIGYKVMKKYPDGQLVYPCQGWMSKVAKVGMWMVDPHAGEFSASYHYTSGYHLFNTWEDANKWRDEFATGDPYEEVIFLTLARRIVATGFQSDAPAFVAEEIMLIEEVTR